MHNHKAGRGVASDNRQDKPETLRTQTYGCPSPPGAGHLPSDGSTAAASPLRAASCPAEEAESRAQCRSPCNRLSEEDTRGLPGVPDAYSMLAGRLHRGTGCAIVGTRT